MYACPLVWKNFRIKQIDRKKYIILYRYIHFKRESFVMRSIADAATVVEKRYLLGMMHTIL